MTDTFVNGFDKQRLSELAEEATVDAHDEEEQVTGFFSVIQDELSLPFRTRMLGVEVEVTDIDIEDDGRDIAAICVRGRHRQPISLRHLPMPSPAPEGAEWVAAFRYWASGPR